MLPRGTPVMIDSSWSSFHGLRGTVVGEDARRRPLPSILVYVPGADMDDEDRKVTYFTREELKVVEDEEQPA